MIEWLKWAYEFYNTILGAAGSNENESSVISGQIIYKSNRHNVCKVDVVHHIFGLLCDGTFLKSRLYSSAVFLCTEKYFRWLNANVGHLLETKDKGELIRPILGLDNNPGSSTRIACVFFMVWLLMIFMSIVKVIASSLLGRRQILLA
jgi:hypothetical protein